MIPQNHIQIWKYVSNSFFIIFEIYFLKSNHPCMTKLIVWNKKKHPCMTKLIVWNKENYTIYNNCNIQRDTLHNNSQDTKSIINNTSMNK